MENEHLDSGDQPTLPPQPPKHLTDDMLRNVFHRLPPEPIALAFVCSSYKPWRRVVHDEENFLRPFRMAHHNIPPLLGLYSDDVHGSLHFTRTTKGAMNLPAPPLASAVEHRPGFHGYGCTHGRLLLDAARDDNSHGELLVWDPLTEEHNLVPSAPGFVRGQSCGAALVCDADHAHHGDCHSSPFRVVFAYSEYMPPGPFHPPSFIRIFVYVYSSVTRSWGGRPAAVLRAREGWHFDRKPSAVSGSGNGASVFWMTGEGRNVLEFHLETERFLLMGTPDATRGEDFVLAPAQDARLGLAGVIDNFFVVLFSRDDDGAWVHRILLRLNAFPFHADADADADGLFGIDIPTYSDDEDGLSDDDDDATEAKVIGFSEQLGSIFLKAEPGVFMISLESGQHQRVLETDQHFSRVYPYCTFYTAAHKVVFNDVNQESESRNIQSGEISNIPSDGGEN
ncbi:hypothetical protein VPH35_100763 [Triticum aestivum]